MGKRLERVGATTGVGSIAWGIVFVAAGLALAGVLVAVPHDGWSAWDFAWRGGGILLLIAAGVGSFLPDLTTSAGVRATTAAIVELDGFTSTYDQTPALAPAIAGLARLDPGPAHVLFHTHRELRFVLVRLCWDRYAALWSPIAARSMMAGLVARTHGDPMWLQLSAYRHLVRGKRREAFADLDAALARDPEDPTPHVLKLFALRASRKSPERTRANARAIYARMPAKPYEAHEQMLHLLAAWPAEMLALARSVAAASPEGSDEAFLPAIAHGIAFTATRDGAYLRTPAVADEIALACRRSFDSPWYRATHRMYRMLHAAAGLHATIGDAARLRGELVRAGSTFDLDVWRPYHDAYPAKAFLAARRMVRL